ncbi:hypothetical protein PSPO01_00989 [Paraphaeosphaeria sporulosa]
MCHICFPSRFLKMLVIAEEAARSVDAALKSSGGTKGRACWNVTVCDCECAVRASARCCGGAASSSDSSLESLETSVLLSLSSFCFFCASRCCACFMSVSASSLLSSELLLAPASSVKTCFGAGFFETAASLVAVFGVSFCFFFASGVGFATPFVFGLWTAMLIDVFFCVSLGLFATSSDESSLSPTSSLLNWPFSFALFGVGTGMGVFLELGAGMGVFVLEPGSGTGVFRGLLMANLRATCARKLELQRFELFEIPPGMPHRRGTRLPDSCALKKTVQLLCHCDLSEHRRATSKMTGKRKRGEAIAKEIPEIAPHNGIAKPLSAIAAARLKLEQAAAPKSTTDSVKEAPPSPLADSTASEAESEPEDISLVPQNFKLSTWRKAKSTVLSDTAKELTIVLDKHATASFVGCFDVKVLKGAVHINGANLGATSNGSKEEESVHRVYVPSTHPITKIRGLDRTNHVQLRSCRKPTPFADINPLFANIWSGDRDGDKSRSFTGVSWSKFPSRATLKSRQVMETDDDPLGRPLVPEHAPEDWLRSIDDISTAASTTFIVGSPTCGKSTFAKRLLNRYLTGFGKTAKSVPAVCYLDLDPSSPEYTPHGQISLTLVRELNLGPAFTHPTTTRGRTNNNSTIAAHVLPHQDLTNYEDHFTACASHLVQTYRSLRLAGPSPPLIINTSGSLYTAHFPLFTTLLNVTKPSHIVHLYAKPSISAATAENLHTLTLLAQKTSATLHELSAQAPILPQPRTPAELRAMHMTSYFHHLSLSPSSSQPIYTPSPLTTLTPWTLSYTPSQTRTQDILALLPLYEQEVPASTLLTASNGCILHIVRTTSPPAVPPRRTPKSKIPYYEHDAETHLPPLLSPDATETICTALLVGVDPRAGELHILVPAPFEDLLPSLDAETTVLVAGCADTPEWAYVEGAYADVSRRRRELGSRAQFAGLEVLGEGVERGPWVERGAVVEGMGYTGAVRRVRRFLG